PLGKKEAVIRLSLFTPTRQRYAVQFTRHDDIGEHQIDSLARCEELQRDGRRFGVKHPVSELLQQHAGNFLDLWIILDQQNPFAPSRRLPLYNALFGELAVATR